MVDCRLCKNHYRIWRDEIGTDKNKYVCLAKEVFIDLKYVANGPCDLYVDVDSDIPRDGDL